MENKFDNLSQEELIKFLNQGRVSPEELAEFTLAMRRKGLSGSIMAVDDRDSEEGRAAVEYVEYHKKIPDDHFKNMPEERVDWAKKILLDEKSTMDEKKEAIITLAHVGRVDVFRTLEKYGENPEKELRIWINMAIDECKSFMESDILGEPFISIGRITKIGRNEPCPCGSGKKFKKCCIDK